MAAKKTRRAKAKPAKTRTPEKAPDEGFTRIPQVMLPTELDNAGPDGDPTCVLLGHFQFLGATMHLQMVAVQEDDSSEPVETVPPAVRECMSHLPDLANLTKPDYVELNGRRYVAWIEPGEI